MTTVVARLSPEDLARFRAIDVRREAYRVKPEGFSVTEIEQNEMAFQRFMGEVAERYELDDVKAWRVSQYSGVIVYGAWEDD